jgi:hypothetical protein
MKLINVGSDSKTIKGEVFGYYTGMMYLAPANESGEMNTCPNASNGCKAACLYNSGLAGVFPKIKEARIKKTKFFVDNRSGFMETLVNDINKLVAMSKRDKMTPACRLNGSSDLAWESIKINGKNLMEHFPDVQFYDYSKSISRMMRFLKGNFPKNYYLTFSRSEDNYESCRKVLRNGGNVAAVFLKNLPEKFMGKTVIVGDDSDLRFNDLKNVIVGLTEKGSKAKKDKSGFVIKVALNKLKVAGFVDYSTPLKFSMKKNGIQLTVA